MLPPSVKVKISSEQAGAIALTPVIAQSMTPLELTRVAVALAGKDLERVGAILRRGTIVSGASRYRWEPLAPSAAEVASLLAAFPDADPSRPFDPARCREVHLIGVSSTIALAREDAAKRRLLRRRSLWDEVLEVAPQPEYMNYSYGKEADVYRSTVLPEGSERLRSASALAAFSRTAEQLRSSSVQRVEFYVTRPPEVR